MNSLTRRAKPTPAPAAGAADGSVIDVIIGAGAWSRSLRTAAAIARRAGFAALAVENRRTPVEVSILLTSDSVVSKLNAAYRKKQGVTDVLSFPAYTDRKGRAQAARALPHGSPQLLGDIAVAYGVLTKDAKAERKTLRAHLSHLVVHGVLHLLGYDHERDAEATTMERLEKEILARIGISDPYALAPAEAGSGAARRKKRALR